MQHLWFCVFFSSNLTSAVLGTLTILQIIWTLFLTRLGPYPEPGLELRIEERVMIYFLYA
jgi:hypothetical protein